MSTDTKQKNTPNDLRDNADYYTETDENGRLITLNAYDDIVIPQNCVDITARAYEDLCALADERNSISVEEGNEKYISRGNCLIEKETGRLVLGCKNSVIPDDGSIKIIGHHAFRGIGGMESENRDIFTRINIPQSVEIIEHHAFSDSGLTHIELPHGLKELGAMAFMLTRLGTDGKRITIPVTVEKMGIGVFSGCSKLCRLRTDNNPYYKSESDCIYDVRTKTVIAVHCGPFGEILPHEAEKVDVFSFLGQNSKTKYYIDNNITEIRRSSLGLPSVIEFPITIVAHEGSYAHRFAMENEIDYEIWE